MDNKDGLQVLSEDHQLGLALINKIRGKWSGPPDSDWPAEGPLQRDQVLDFFDREFETHLRAEEEFLFPAAENCFTSGVDLVSLLRKQHGQIRALVKQLR